MLIGSASGAILCLLLRFFNDVDTDEGIIMTDRMFFTTLHGLRNQREKKKKKKKRRPLVPNDVPRK